MTQPSRTPIPCPSFEPAALDVTHTSAIDPSVACTCNPITAPSHPPLHHRACAAVLAYVDVPDDLEDDPSPTTGGPYGEDDHPGCGVCYYREDADYGAVRITPMGVGGCPVHTPAFPGYSLAAEACAEPLDLTVMRVAGCFGIHPPDLLDWHARADHDADPAHELYPKVLDSAAQCFTNDEHSQNRHGIDRWKVPVAAHLQIRLPRRGRR